MIDNGGEDTQDTKKPKSDEYNKFLEDLSYIAAKEVNEILNDKESMKDTKALGEVVKQKITNIIEDMDSPYLKNIPA